MAKPRLIEAIELPDDAEAAKAALRESPMFDDFHGSAVTAVYAGNTIGANQIFERSADPVLIKAILAQVTAFKG